ncbi:MAG: ribonuclease P [Nanoarchaeota archaeon]
MERRGKPEWQKELAEERIAILFREALKAVKGNKQARANRYIFLARKLAMKFNLRFAREQRRRFCHKCYAYLLPGNNIQVKINSKLKAVEYKCKACKHINRYPYVKERSER